MNINLTIIVQLVHFLVAYVLVRTFLLKPAVRVIAGEQEEWEHLANALEIGKKIIAEREREKQRRWAQCQALFAKGIPGERKRGIFRFEPIELDRLGSYSIDEIDAYVHEVEQVVVQKVKHVR